MLHDLGETPSIHGVDDVHQYRVVPFLRGLFPDAVIDAIQRHVDAKRYLCATRPEYHDSLSEDSKRSLKLQGGIFTEQEAATFIAEPGAKDAVRVRLWDDLAKQPSLVTPGLSHYMQIARRCALKD
jgi:predicted HD phosphohydrolase